MQRNHRVFSQATLQLSHWMEHVVRYLPYVEGGYPDTSVSPRYTAHRVLVHITWRRNLKGGRPTCRLHVQPSTRPCTATEAAVRVPSSAHLALAAQTSGQEGRPPRPSPGAFSASLCFLLPACLSACRPANPSVALSNTGRSRVLVSMLSATISPWRNPIT